MGGPELKPASRFSANVGLAHAAQRPSPNVRAQARSASRLRARAKEVSVKAETFQNADLQQKMREVAAGYESLAKQVEKQSFEAPPPS
jgi:hypothetical protein